MTRLWPSPLGLAWVVEPATIRAGIGRGSGFIGAVDSARGTKPSASVGRTPDGAEPAPARPSIVACLRRERDCERGFTRSRQTHDENLAHRVALLGAAQKVR